MCVIKDDVTFLGNTDMKRAMRRPPPPRDEMELTLIEIRELLKSGASRNAIYQHWQLDKATLRVRTVRMHGMEALHSF